MVIELLGGSVHLIYIEPEYDTPRYMCETIGPDANSMAAVNNKTH